MDKNQILLSIIIPSYKRSANTHRLLSDLTQQVTKDTRHQIILIDDSGSPEHAALYEDVIKEFSEFPIRLQHRPRNNDIRQGIGAVRNFGTSFATGTHYLFLDDDVLISEDFIQNTVALIADHPEHIICGRIYPLPPENPFETFLTVSRTYFGFEGLVHGQPCAFSYLFTANCCIPAVLFAKQPFVEYATYGYEDLTYAYEMSLKGAVFTFNDKSSVIHNDRPTFAMFFKRKFQSAQLVPEIVAKYPELAKILHYSSRFRYFPFHTLPSDRILKVLENCIAGIVKVTGWYSLYRYLLGIVFIAGMSRALNSKPNV